VGNVLLANVRRDSLVGRVGGDEFGVLLPETSLHDTAAIAMRLCIALLAARPLVLGGDPEIVERITLSIGVAGARAGESGASWCARADAALYNAKRNGRNRISIAPLLELTP
jgi:diguanylate cyclase